MNTSETINICESFNLTGRLTDGDGRALKYTSVGVLLRGTAYGEKEYKNYIKKYARTDKDGYYSYKIEPELAGRYDICVYYPGYHNYGFSEEIGSFTVISISPVIDIDFIRNMHLGSSTKILGLLTTYDRKPLSNEKVNVQLVYCDDNSQYDLESCEVLTDENGAFVAKWYDNNSIYYTPKYVGEYLVQARYVNDSDYYFQENGFTVYN